MRTSSRLCAITILLALCTMEQSARATTVLPTDVDALVDQSRLIFTGTAVHREVVLSQDGSFPFTFITFRVDETLKGKVRDRELTLRFPGGDIGDQVVVVVGAPEFEMGERYLLFIADNGTTSFPVVGWRQGQYRFAREPRSGASVLVDDQGRGLGGIQGGDWQRHSLPAPDVSTVPASVLLGEEEIDVSDLPVAEIKAGPGTLPEARKALAALRRHVGGRSGLATFLPGRFVDSARPEDVPVSVEWTSVPPAR